ncbi:MAG TPA: DNA-binding domain-containing protein, partial [Steroidobacteraceae bacterium]
RIGIYANNVRENFLGTLAATFPVLGRLGGRDWLRSVGTSYWQAFPSRTGNLHHVGQHFATFLGAHLCDTPYAYFADVAQLEWAYQQVLVAREPAPFDRAALAALPPSEHGAIVFELHAAARLVASVYPLFAIWESNQRDDTAGASATISLDAGPSRLLVIRRRDHVELRELPPGDFALLMAIARQHRLESAAVQALEADPGFDLPQALTRLVQLEAITGWHLPPSNTPPDPSNLESLPC